MSTTPKQHPRAQQLVDIIAQGLAGTWHCGRVWEAWSVGTMSQEDFSPVDESDTPHELAHAVLDFILKEQEEVRQMPSDPMDWPLPCDVKIGSGTMHKGVPLRTLVLRMQTLHDWAAPAAMKAIKAAEGSQPALPLSVADVVSWGDGKPLDIDWHDCSRLAVGTGLYTAEQMRAYAAQAVAAQAAPAANQIASQGQEAKPVVEKLAFVNGAPAACGCRHEFSSGGGEYSDVAYVHLCPAHAGVVPRNVLDDEWRRRLLDGAAIERDEMGCGEHPALPLLEEGMKPKQFFDALGIELQCVMAEDQMDMDAYEAMIEVPNYNAWTPGAPDGEEWKQVAIFDTEDGPACWWIREAPPSPRIRHPRNTPAAVAVPPKAITASLMLDDGGERPVYCLMAAYPSEADARAALAALAAIPEPPATEDSSAGDLAEGPAGSGGWKVHAESLEKECAYWKTIAETMRAHACKDVWYWQGDGSDNPQSMVNSLAVVLRADQLCDLLAQAQAEVPDGFGSAEHWKEKAQYWAGVAHELRGQALRGEPVDGIIQPSSQAEVQAEPVAWMRKTDITELTDSEPETDGWTPLYTAPQAQPADALDAAQEGGAS